LFPDITLIYIFYPETSIKEHSEISRVIQKYHYGLKISKLMLVLKLIIILLIGLKKKVLYGMIQ